MGLQETVSLVVCYLRASVALFSDLLHTQTTTDSTIQMTTLVGTTGQPEVGARVPLTAIHCLSWPVVRLSVCLSGSLVGWMSRLARFRVQQNVNKPYVLLLSLAPLLLHFLRTIDETVAKAALARLQFAAIAAAAAAAVACERSMPALRLASQARDPRRRESIASWHMLFGWHKISPLLAFPLF